MMLNLPDISQAFNGNTNEQILDSLQKYRKELNFLLMNLDETNMPEIAGRLDGIDGSFSLIDQQLDSITLAVGNAEGGISALSLRADGIDLAVSNNAGSISALSITVGGIQSTVSSQGALITSQGTIIGTHTSQITQLGNSISSIVSFTDVTGNQIASKINQTATTITIQASKIDLTGITTIYGDSAGDYVTVDNGMMSFFESNDEVFRILPTSVGAALYNPSGSTVAIYEDLLAMYDLDVSGDMYVETGSIDVRDLYVSRYLYVGSDRVVTTDGELHIDTTSYGIVFQKSGYTPISILWGADLPQ